MQRLRTTFKRSRTPTGAEMKTQSSLEVPKQVRSASFDEIQLEAKRNQQLLQGADNSMDGGGGGSFLKVPQYVNQRSKSFDSGGSAEQDVAATFLEVPVRRFQRRRSSSDKMPPACFHCICVEEYTRLRTAELADELLQLEEKRRASQRSFSYSDDTSSSGEWEGEGGGDDTEGDREGENDADDDDDDDESFEVSAITGEDVEKGEVRRNLHSPCSIRVTLSPNSPSSQSDADCGTSGGEEVAMVMIQPPPTPGTPTLRRRSITSPKLSRQEAFVVVEPGSNSLENVSDVPSEGSESAASVCGGGGSVSDAPGLIVNDIYLKVPELKRDRAASVDSCFTKVSSSNKTEELDTTGSLLEPPAPQVVALRSRSVDIVLPTDEQARYKALAMATTATSSSVFGHSVKGYVRLVRYVRQHAALRTAGGKGKAVTPGENSEQRVLRSTPDWSETAINGEHLWAPTSASGDFCYVGEGDCTKHGPRMKCSACKIICHTNCINVLIDKTKFTCKPTFRDVGVRQYREQTSIHHHWVHRRSQKGKCKQCGKSFQSKLSFSSKEIVALSCSWCKTAYHNKESCFNLQKIGEDCNLGCHNGIIVPPSWIVKLPRRGSFKSSLRKSPKKKTASKKKSKEKNEKDQRTFVIKPIPSASVKPVIVFINPKSGGNQGVKLLQKFQWLLNPRQVFDLTQGGPRMGLEMFRKVPNLRVLACGGDGTVGWVLSILDQIGISPAPAVGVLPLGTGNDLARALGWGGGYTDEPISKILMNIGESDVVLLDRWELKVEKNPDVEANEEGKENLPLNVVNNYFSLGVDAHIALEFHEAREAHPERFNSRLRNKMFYGQAGGKDLVKRKWKGLAEFVTLECDGEDLTPKLKDHKVHAIVFLNIPSYGGGTHPWNRAGGTVEPATDDGLIEVVGLTTYQLPLLQAGGHGTCITQCKSARIVTTKTIPMQVDGEACKLMPSNITMSLLNKASMLAKRKGGKSNVQQATLETMKVNVDCITMSNYEQYHYDKDVLQKSAVSLGEIEVNPVADLDQIRKIINKLMEEKLEDYNPEKGLPEWCFVDSCTAERFFRIDGAQEHLHYVTDIAGDRLFVLNMGYRTNSPEDETACPSPSTSENKQISPQSMPEEEPTGPELSYEASREDDESNWNAGENVIEGIQNSDHIEKSHGEEQHIDGEEERNNHNIEKLNLEHASPQGNINYLSQLLEKTTDGILKAAKLGDLNMLRNLHSQGYSLLSIDSNGQTALHYGSRYGHKDIVKYLIACAPPSILNMVDNDKGQTALHKAAAHKRRSICCMLVAGGASLKVCDHQGNTPLHLAISANDQELAAYLKSQEDFQLVSEDIETVV